MNDNYLDLFEKYQRRELSRDQEREFISRLTNEKQINKDFEYYRLAIKGIQAHELNKKLHDIHMQIYPNRRTWKKWAWSVAAAILMFVTSISLIFRWQGDHTQKIFDQFFHTFPDLITTRAPSTSFVQEGMANYRNQNYEKAISILTLISEDNPNYTVVRFYLAVSLLADNRVPEAIELFKELKSTKFNQQATWYLALCYLKSGDIETVVKQLQQIKAGENFYIESQKLLERLKTYPGLSE